MREFRFNPGHQRIKRVRSAQTYTPGVQTLIQMASLASMVVGGAIAILGVHSGFSLIGMGIILGCWLIWIRHGLLRTNAQPLSASPELAELLPAETLTWYQPNLSAEQLFDHLCETADGQFLLLHYQLAPQDCRTAASGWTAIHHDIWSATADLVEKLGQSYLTNAAILAACFNLHPPLKALLTSHKLTLDDMYRGVRWTVRLNQYQNAKRPMYGGIARDWAAGFTPMLAHFGSNLSQQVEYAGKYFQLEERTTQLDTLVGALTGPNANAVLVGEPGIGKTALMLGLADRVLQGVEVGRLAHHQIINLSASVILSEAGEVGSIEEVVLSLFNEAIQAGNIVIALDEAQLFFGHGTGAVNLSQVLLPYVQSRTLVLVLAVTPGDWQKLKATNTALASLLTPIILSEPGQDETIATIADRALLMESTANAVITYDALQEAYRLSGRYFQEEAYPGRALKVLEGSLAMAQDSIVNARSVQLAIEGQFGVKAGTASAAESDVLLGMEDKIHERMINQTRAVSVVSNALRRARAGVANPKRPIGSFLFLGPTGVGKTELARSLAAVYFGDQDNVIRLDMSEYQQIADVDRILEDASINPAGLLPKIRQAPFSVVLFDEIEKAHPNILNLFLQMLDEGSLTDLSSRPASFKDAIIIATSNAGAEEIRERIEEGQALESFEQPFIDNLVTSGQFKPELLNRFDEIVLFRPLKPAELVQVVGIMLKEVNKNLEPQQITVELTEAAIATLVEQGYDPRLGARPMRRMVTRRVEDAVAAMILKAEAQPGSHIVLDVDQLAGDPNANS